MGGKPYICAVCNRQTTEGGPELGHHQSPYLLIRHIRNEITRELQSTWRTRALVEECFLPHFEEYGRRYPAYGDVKPYQPEKGE